jgi:hypothetical protein
MVDDGFGIFIVKFDDSEQYAIFKIVDFVNIRRRLPLGDFPGNADFVDEAIALDSRSPTYPISTSAMALKVADYSSYKSALADFDSQRFRLRIRRDPIKVSQQKSKAILFLPIEAFAKGMVSTAGPHLAK